MDLAGMTYTQALLGILLVPLMGLDGARGPCPTPCRCTVEILNCSRITNSLGLHRVPLPKVARSPPPFTYLDLTGNEISSIGKEAWEAYPWAERLILKDNNLKRLQNTSLEGLLSLTYLDVSCNKIQIIEMNAFETSPFLQVINLSGNDIRRITYGTFRAWHGMQFLLKVDLSHNPLAVIQDSYFYSLPSLKVLDLGATYVTLKMLEDLIQATLHLRTLIVPRKISCCLCSIKEDIEVLCDTIKLECTEPCAINAPLCEKEEPLMQKEVVKALEIRKLNGRSLLNILPERAILNNDLPERTEHNNDRLAWAEICSSLPANFKLLESAKRLMQVKVEESLNVNWDDKGGLKKLYLLACLLHEVLKERIVELEKDSLEATVQNALSSQALKVSTDKASKGSNDASLWKERNARKVTRETWLGTNQRLKDRLTRLSRDGQEVAEIAAQSADQPSVFQLYNQAGSQIKLVEGLDSQHALPFHGSHHIADQSSWKRSNSDSLTNAFKPPGSIIVDNNDNDLTSLSRDDRPLLVLGNGVGAQIMTKEDLLKQLIHKSNPPAVDGKSKISAIESETSLNELLHDIPLSRGTYSRVSPPLKLAPQDDYLLQGDLFEAGLNEQLTAFIPKAPVRKLISHVIRILKIDCTVPTNQMACTKLISKTGLLMKLLSANVSATSSLWKSYFWPSKNVANRTAANSRKLEKPLGRTTSQGIPANGYEMKLLWALSVTSVIMMIIAVICLIEICSQRSAAKGRTFLGKRKKSLPDPENPRTDSPLVDKPPWLKDMYQTQDETQNNKADKLNAEESPEKVDTVTQGSASTSLSERLLKKISSKTLSISTSEAPSTPTTEQPTLPPPPPPEPSSPRKPSLKKGSVSVGEHSEVTSSKAATSTGPGEDDESSAESPTTEATSDTSESEDEDD